MGVYLRCLAGDRPRSWLHWLPWAEYCYDSSYQSALQTTPFQVVYGRPPPTLLSYKPGVAQVVALDRQLLERDVFLADIRECLLQAQDYMKEHHDKTHRRVEFEVGDWVWLRLHHRAVASVKGGSSKLSPHYYGPFQVLARIGSVAYRLQLPPKSRLHDVFHVVFLKKYTGDSPTTTVPLPPIVHGRVVPAPAAVLRARPSSTSWDLLVQWQGQSNADATWEPLEQFKESFPDFQLEDKLFSYGEGSVVDRFFGHKFQRRNKKAASTSG